MTPAEFDYNGDPVCDLCGAMPPDPVQPAPPPPGVPLDETAAPIHYEGDTKSS